MGGDIIGLVAVIMSLGVPLGALYTYYRVRKLRSEERLAAIARGVDIPMEPELNQAGRSRRASGPRFLTRPSLPDTSDRWSARLPSIRASGCWSGSSSIRWRIRVGPGPKSPPNSPRRR